MRITYLVFWLTLGTLSSHLKAQTFQRLWFKTEVVEAEYELQNSFNRKDEIFKEHIWDDKFYGIVLLPEELPQLQLDELKKVVLFTDYLPENSFYVVVNQDFNTEIWDKLGIKALIPVKESWKLDPNVTTPWEEGTLKRILIHYFDASEKNRYRNHLESMGFAILEDHYLSKGFEIECDRKGLDKLISTPFIHYITLPAPEVETNNWDERTNHRVPAVESGSGVYALTGKNVIVGEWDGAGVGTHIDYDFRHVIMQPHFNNSNGAHATHVAGTVLGGGILNPVAKGMAPQASLYSWDFVGNIPVEMDSGALRQKIEITQNSYSYSVDACATRGGYDINSAALDALVNKYPHLLHVYAAGNSRSANCMSGGYRTVHSGFQASKNSLVVAAVTHLDANSTFHSYGPTLDGRLKPDVSAVGVNVYSTAHNHTYLGGYSGTSMACPGTSGTAALIYELFETKYGKQPAAHTIKGFMCNASDDIGRPGPDYMYGFGRINARVAADILSRNQFVTRNIIQSAQYMDTIFIPRNSHELKVFLGWDDVPASTSVSKSLVNDLDLVLFDSSGNQILPWILNPANPTANAIRGVDTLNNTEQITISKPTSPYYIYKVSGTRIPVGSEEYTLNWNILDTGITVTYPNGDEKWVPPSSSANAQIIRWDNRGISGNVKIEYSINAGATWTQIIGSTPASNLYYVWQTCPDTVVTSRALIRISAPGVSDVSDSVFHIMKTPSTPNGIVCEGQVHLTWAALSGALGYEVYMHDSGVMKLVGTTNIPEFTVRNLKNNDTVWISVSALGKNGAKSERSLARSFIVSGTNKPPKFTVQPLDMRICLGKDTSVTIALTGTATITSYWQYSDNQGATWIKTGADNQLKLNVTNPAMSINNRWYRHYAVNLCQSKEYSLVAKLMIDSSFSFKYHASEVKACIGQDTAIVLQYSSSNIPAYQWYYQKNLSDIPMPVSGTYNRLKLMNNQKSGQGYYKVSLQNACGAIQNNSPVYLRVRDPLVISVPAHDTICQGNSFLLQATASGGDTSNYQFQWLSDEGINSGSKVTVEPSRTTQYTASVFDRCSEDTVKTNYTLFVRDSLKLTLLKDTVICMGTSANLTANVSGGLLKNYTYMWSDGLSDAPQHTVSPLTTREYSLTFTDHCTQYVSSDTILVTVLDPLNVVITASKDTLCVGQFVELRANSSGGKNSAYQFKWSNGSLGDKINVNPATTATYSVKLEDNCTVMPIYDTITVQVRMPLQAQIEGKDSTCFDVVTNYKAQVSGGNVSGYKYFWQGTSGIELFDKASKQSYRLYLKVEDGCTVSDAFDTLDVFVYDSLAIGANFTDSLVCFGQPIFLSLKPSGGRVGFYSANWSNGSNVITGILTTNTIDEVYRLTLSDGCSHPATHHYNIKTRPKLEVSAGKDIRICEGSEASVMLNALGGLSSNYKLKVNGGEVPLNYKIKYSGTAADTMLYLIHLSDGCSAPDAADTLMISVDDVNPIFTISKRYDKELYIETPLTPHDAVVQFGDGFSISGPQTDYMHIYQDYGMYEVCRYVSSDIGCRDTFCENIHMYDVFKTSDFSISISPNPTTGKVFAQFDKIAGNLTVQIHDATGRLITQKSVINYLEDKVEIDLGPYAPAAYWIRIISNEEVQVFKVIRT